MDTDSLTPFELLHYYSTDNLNGPSNCESLLSTINDNLTNEQLSLSTIDSYLYQIFDEHNGLLSFVQKVVPQKVFNKSVLSTLEIWYALINNFPLKLSKNILEINEICMVIVRSSASASEKTKALDVLELSFAKIDKCLDNKEKYRNILELISLIVSIKSSPTVVSKLYSALGMYAKKFPYMLDEPNNLKVLFTNNLETEMKRADKNKTAAIAGLFTGFTYFCQSFSLEPDTDKDLILQLYKYIKDLAIPKSRVKINNRAALTFFASNIDLFSGILLKQYAKWQKVLLSWLEMGAEERRVGESTLRALYRGLGKHLEQETDADKDIIRFFIQQFQSNLKSDTSNTIKCLSLQGLSSFSGAAYKHLPSNEYSDLFTTVNQNFEQLFILNEDPSTDNWEFLPNYIETVACLIKYKNLNPTHQLFTLQKAMINLIKSFPRIHVSQHYLVIDALISSLCWLKDNRHFDGFLEVVVYQGVVWSCSHQHLSDADVFEGGPEKIITIKNYFPLWIGLFNQLYSHITRGDRKYLVAKLLDQMIKTLMVLINKLNVEVSVKETNSHMTEIQTAFHVEHASDFAIFLNVVDFYGQIFKSVEAKLFKNCIGQLINHLITKCLKYPLISGFYKLLSFCLRITQQLKYFEEIGSSQDAVICAKNVKKFLGIVLKKMAHFKDELLIACLSVLLETSPTIIEEILPECSTAFITVFHVGRSHLPLAEMGLTTLENWKSCLPPKPFNEFLSKIIPCLDSYLRSKFIGGQNITNEKRRKTSQLLKRRKVVVQIESDLVQFQKRVLNFIGQQNNEICKVFTASEHYLENETWGAQNHLKVTLPYEDVKLEVYLDGFVPRIVDLALYCSDRKTRITACELLHGIVMVFLGKTKPMSHSGLADLDEFLRNISLPLLKLGCDLDQVVQQLFQPLFLQLIHWYSSRMQLRSSHSAIIIETLMEGISHPTDSSLRDFSGSCIEEFVKWTIRQSSEAGLAQDPTNIKTLVKKMRFFSTHPDPNKKLGAALILNNIYKNLREEHEMISMFSMEMLHIFISSLDLIEFDDDELMIEQINLALKHLQRILVEKHDVFNKDDNQRRVPSDIKGSTLKALAMWLLEQTGSRSKYCREKSMELFCALAPLVPGYGNNLPDFIIGNLGRKNYWIPEYYEKYLEPSLDVKGSCDHVTVLLKWLQYFLCALDGYNFVIKNNLATVEVTVNSKVFKAMRYFLQNLQTADIRKAIGLIEPNGVFNSIDKERYYILKSNCAVMILKLVNSVISNELICQQSTIFWNVDLWNLIGNFVFAPHEISLEVLQSPDILKVLLNNLPRKIPKENLVALSQVLKQYFEGNMQNYVNFSDTTLKKRNCVSGLLLLVNTPFRDGLQLEKVTSGLTKAVLNSMFSTKEDNKFLVHVLENTALKHCTSLLELAFSNERELIPLLEILYKPCMVYNIKQEKDVKFSDYILDLFEEITMKILVENIDTFWLYSGTPQDTIELSYKILAYLSKNKHKFRHSFPVIAKGFLGKWPEFCGYFQEDIITGLCYLKRLLEITKTVTSSDWIAVVDWLSKLLMEQDDLDISVEVFGLLVDLLDESSHEPESLSFGLLKLTNALTSDTNLNETTKLVTFNKLTCALPRNKSSKVFKFLIEIYVKLSLEVDLKPAVAKFIARSSDSLQENSLNLAYDLCTSNELSCEEKYKISSEILPVVLQNTNVKTLELFFVRNIATILSDLKTPTTLDNLTIKTTYFILIEALFLRIPFDGGANNPIIIESKNPKLVFTLLKFAFDAQVATLELVEQARLFKCHSYNASVSIICNAVKNSQPNFYPKLFSRLSDDVDVLWAGVVDTTKTLNFEKEFDTLPKQRKCLVSIRDELRAERKLASETKSSSLQYIESQRLINSSLAEDISKFDFNNSIVRYEVEDNVENERKGAVCQSELQLDAVEVNHHECMGSVCGLIEYIFRAGISELPEEGDEDVLPNWIKGLRDTLLSKETHKNVKIFLVKVIDNLADIFKHYAKWFLEPLLLFITEKCAGDTINYFTTDVLSLLTSWSLLVEPKEHEITLTNSVLEFIITNTNNDRKDSFKYHLELVKLITEVWKKFIVFPFELIISKLELQTNDRKLEVPIHLTSIFFVNRVCPPKHQLDILGEKLLNIMRNSTEKSIYRVTAETLGLILRNLDNPSSQLGSKVDDLLKKIEDPEKYAFCLEGVTLHYPSAAETFHLYRIFSRLNGPIITLKKIYLKIIFLRCDFLDDISDFKEENWGLYLASENLDVVFITLEILLKTIELLQETLEFPSLVTSLCKKWNHPNPICRRRMLDLTMLIYEKISNENIQNMCKDVLIQALIDNDLEIREKLYEFWTNNNRMPDEIAKRFRYILCELYRTNTEDNFLGYSTYFLLERLRKTGAYEEILFEHPLEDCDFEEYRLLLNWRLQNPAVVPMFADTLQSQAVNMDYSSSDFNKIRNTLQSFSFAPTEKTSASNQYSQYTAVESSLMVDDSKIINPNKIQLSQRYRVRFIKDKRKIQKQFAQREVTKIVTKVQARVDLAKEREKKVNIYRSYRKGEFPDIQIELGAILKPLQILTLHDSEISKILYTSIFNSLIKCDHESFMTDIPKSIQNIFSNSTQCNTNLFRTLLDIVLNYKEKIWNDPRLPILVANVCQKSGLLSTGTLILEEYLISHDGEPTGGKQGCASGDNMETSLWVKLAELYKDLEDWDMVQSIFVEKMNCKEEVQKAIKSESACQWRDAQECYMSLIQNDFSLERRDFYHESYFKCFANLSEWHELPNAITTVIDVPDNESTWSYLWKDKWKQKVLPWYVTAHLKDALFTGKANTEFLTELNTSLRTPKQSSYLQDNFAEELCMLWVHKNDMDAANQYLKKYLDKFLDDWQFVHPQFAQLRYHKLLKLRNIIDIGTFVSLYENFEEDYEEKKCLLQKFLLNNSSETLPTLMMSETRLLYRKQFVQLMEKRSATGMDLEDVKVALKEIKTKLDLDFINNAVGFKNFHIARKYFKCVLSYVNSKDPSVTMTLCNVLYLKTQMIPNLQDKLAPLLEILPKLDQIFEASNDSEKLPGALKLLQISTDLETIFNSNESLLVEKQSALGKVLGRTVKNPDDCLKYGTEKLRNVLETYEKHLSEFMDSDDVQPRKECLKIASAYVTLAYTERKHSETSEGKRNFILYVLRAMKYNSLEAKQLFPCILMEDELGNRYKELFIQETATIPTWMFLGWIPQLLANVDSAKIFAISGIILRIAESYPQSIMYAYRLSKENYDFSTGTPEDVEGQLLVEKLDKLLLNDPTVDKFLSALANVSVPAVNLQHYIKQMYKAAARQSSKKVSQLHTVILDQLYGGVISSRDTESMKGQMFKRIDPFKREIERLPLTNFKKLPEICKQINEKLDNFIQAEGNKPSTLLKDYCPWLSNFSAAKLNTELEIPGQYDGNQLPLVQHHIKISGFCPSVSVMSSLRKPIKVTLLGMDSKEYPFLIKFGEDIRQDQRIQQLFTMMNNIFTKREQNVLTYQVIPLTSSLGIIQWINNTDSLQNVILRTMNIKTILNTTMNKFEKFVSGNKNVPQVQYYGQAALKLHRNKVIPFYQSLVNMVPLDALKSSFWSISSCTENFIALRNNFIQSYAVLCAAQWVLGIGDRHLNNSLICMKTGKVLGIDFGHAFGTATQILPIPELVPFRLTPHIVALMEPFKEHGYFKQFMISCLRDLRENSESLLATMTVFIQEPSLDWLEQALKFSDTSTSENITWYPMRKVAQAQRKLQGATSTSILIEDLKMGHQNNPQVLEAYVKMVKGSVEFDLRARLDKEDDLTVEKQVECLIDHATDYNLLGRMYSGWTSWI